jgi:hypothetical protein
MGGLGLFDLQSFLDAQKIAWVKRARTLDDWWKIVIYSRSYGNVLNIRSKHFDISSEPCITSIVKSYEKFMTNLTKTDENFLDSYIFDNKALTLGLRDNRVLNENQFARDFFNQYGHQLKGLRTSDLCNGDAIVSLNEFRVNTGIPVPLAQFRMMKDIVETAKIRYRKTELGDKRTIDIATFVNRSKKGSKRFRIILTSEIRNYIPHNIVKFASNMEIILGLESAKKINSSWHSNVFNNSTKTFLFKFYNNILGYNNAVAHFIRNHSPNCTFCDIAGVQEIINETPLHLFFGCDVVENFLNIIVRWLTNDDQFEISRQELFTYFDRQGFTPARNNVLTVLSKLLLKFIWDCKQRQILPVVGHCKISMVLEIKSLMETNSKFKKTFLSSGMGEFIFN